MTNYECGRALVYIAEQIIKTFGKDFGLEVQEPKQAPKEPLIKDEKIRKAVRAWAEANSLKSFEYADDDGLGSFLGADYERITFNPWRQSGLKDGETYTIAELCGEEEE